MPSSVDKILQAARTKIDAEADILLAHCLQKERVFLYAHPEYEVTARQARHFRRLVKKRQNHWPIAYLTGEKEFYGLSFKVNRHTLVPRPESELFIEELKKIQPQNKTLLDIGTGSGCLIITAARLWPKNNFLAVDVSRRARRVARSNARRQAVTVKFIKSDLLNFYRKQKISPDIILANLPYLTPEEMKETSLQKEPSLALCGGHDGLEQYRRLFRQLNKLKLDPQYLLCEINPSQKTVFTKLIETDLPKYNLVIKNDLSDRPRLAIITKIDN